MKKCIITLVSLFITGLFLVGCGSSNTNNNSSIEDIALSEAKKITAKHGYSLKSESYNDVQLGDSEVFKLIKDASIKSGYSKDDLNSLTDEIKIIEYQLKETSKKDSPIMLSLVIDKKKVIGAFLDYSEYSKGIEPIYFKDNFK